MHPCECGGKYVKKRASLEIQDPFVGPVKRDRVDYEECDRCGELILPLETARAFDTAAEALLDDNLKKQPIRDFLTASETAAALGITKQALHKNRRIRHGFIYRTSLGGLAVYLKKSVELYKKKGDGRFPLSELASNLGEKPASATRAVDSVYRVHEG